MQMKAHAGNSQDIFKQRQLVFYLLNQLSEVN